MYLCRRLKEVFRPVQCGEKYFQRPRWHHRPPDQSIRSAPLR
ncbi:Uncharacterised protein [Vibrio cholerae]|nr:Uncharacterised protein [Vibrio cholerae]CSI57860.1 Uncharacterised protein [Vibrio cholerae]